ncbi:hypothetical protein [Mucilaginibacter sp.]|uniref:hypothetical protein n=1 Tax=Mucilaginibacter sp. TaxID=1882438 RepID=UPI002626C755|nr:hypothetical protein [Mucilaginibacter sp.]MDB4926045.1 hypothetical protein [Mucilaginibacter sp.]
MSFLLRRCIFFVLIATIFSCKFKEEDRHNTSFKKVTGIYYTEVRRNFDSGLAFNQYGYQLSSIWRLMFYSDSYASVYNPDKNIFLKFPVTLDHDSIFNISGAWLKALQVTKDSLKLQVLQVKGKSIYWARSNVYMTFYADNYIKNVLHKDTVDLRKPQRKDSLFIMKRIAMVNANPDSSFAARETVVFKSKSSLVKVKKEAVAADIMNKWDNSDEYMYPEYTITINKAYQDFSYSFLATVDTQGQLHFQRSLVYVFPEFEKSTIRIIKGIIDGYLKLYVQVTPGKTLQIPHNSAVTLNVVGKKG